ncbi:hypothetical protein [Natrinema versiforme]|uniref:DUF2178 domain-containing protein n=1 Tax=Natrinema versiforme JCM 10478 TaxID=1227496 RepID=L9XPI8_9EURY|nr:hypothetical protein [Natrinema versiforme]ELY63351.1 hypothetical protein C489_19051 [Natrinema versiforme JCM 10478]
MTATNTSSKLTRQRYRGLVYGIGGLAILGLLAGFILNQHFVGTLIYLLGVWIAGGIAVLAPMWSEATLQDERDWELHNRASGILVGITMVFGLSILPALYVLDAGNYIEITGIASGVILTLSALFLLYGVCLGIAKRRI